MCEQICSPVGLHAREEKVATVKISTLMYAPINQTAHQRYDCPRPSDLQFSQGLSAEIPPPQFTRKENVFQDYGGSFGYLKMMVR